MGIWLETYDTGSLEGTVYPDKSEFMFFPVLHPHCHHPGSRNRDPQYLCGRGSGKAGEGDEGLRKCIKDQVSGILWGVGNTGRTDCAGLLRNNVLLGVAFSGSDDADDYPSPRSICGGGNIDDSILLLYAGLYGSAPWKGNKEFLFAGILKSSLQHLV